MRLFLERTCLCAEKSFTSQPSSQPSDAASVMLMECLQQPCLLHAISRITTIGMPRYFFILAV